MHRRTLHRLALATTLALAATGAAHAQQTIRLTAAGGHPPVFLWVKLIDEFFIPEVDKRLAAAGGQDQNRLDARLGRHAHQNRQRIQGHCRRRGRHWFCWHHL
ncbi:MAG: hypothetical protein V9G23_12010 [Giesbergeria sp.]